MIKNADEIPEIDNEGIQILIQEKHFLTKRDVNIDVSDMRSFLSLKFTVQERDISHFFDIESAKDENDDVEYIDYDKLHFPLMLRHKKEGDFFFPMGLYQKKKLSKFFIDEKYSLFDKKQQWLLCSGNDIVWVIGKRLDNRFRVRKETKKILKIEKI